MIRFVIVPGHEYTFNALRDPNKRVREMPVEVWTYPALFAATELPPGTWIFSDIERLGVWELRLAGEVARVMRETGSGFRVLNDPARAASRYELLFRLHRSGFNGFRAWRAEDGVPQPRFPVFIRIESNHSWPLAGLIHNRRDLAGTIKLLEQRGVPRRGLLIIEYQAEEFSPGVFRKYGAYRFGDRIVADHMVHDTNWLAKYGTEEAWTDPVYADEAAYVRENPHAEELMKAFEIGAIEYGRADYGIVDGKLQIWEINTNPALPSGALDKCPPQRAEATVTALQNRVAAIEALDMSGGQALAMKSDLLDAHRDRQKTIHRDMIRE